MGKQPHRTAENFGDENQLTNVYVTSAWRSEFKYDAFGRRRVRKEYTWQSSAWVLTNEVRYVYDGMLVVCRWIGSWFGAQSYPNGVANEPDIFP